MTARIHREDLIVNQLLLSTFLIITIIYYIIPQTLNGIFFYVTILAHQGGVDTIDM